MTKQTQQTSDLSLPPIPKLETGEVIPAHLIKPKDFEKFISSIPNEKLADLLTRINFVTKIGKKLEKAIKDYIKTGKPIKFDEEGIAFFENWRLKKMSKRRFSERLLENEGSEMHKEWWRTLKEKYSINTDEIQFK